VLTPCKQKRLAWATQSGSRRRIACIGNSGGQDARQTAGKMPALRKR